MKEFMSDNYIIIIIVAGFLIFALIGFIVDTTKNKKLKKEEENKEIDNIKKEDIAIVDSNVTESISNAEIPAVEIRQPTEAKEEELESKDDK